MKKIFFSTFLVFLAIGCATLQNKSNKFTDGELARLTAFEAVQMIKEQKITSVELVSALIAKANQNKSLNAYIRQGIVPISKTKDTAGPITKHN